MTKAPIVAMLLTATATAANADPTTLPGGQIGPTPPVTYPDGHIPPGPPILPPPPPPVVNPGGPILITCIVGVGCTTRRY